MISKIRVPLPKQTERIFRDKRKYNRQKNKGEVRKSKEDWDAEERKFRYETGQYPE